MAEQEMFAFEAEISKLRSINFSVSLSMRFTATRRFLSLISNASDALDKIRFQGLTDKSKLDSQPELFIHIIPNRFGEQPR